MAGCSVQLALQYVMKSAVTQTRIQTLWKVSELSLQSFHMGDLTVAPYNDSVFPEEFTSGYIGIALNFVSSCHMLLVPMK